MRGIFILILFLLQREQQGFKKSRPESAAGGLKLNASSSSFDFLGTNHAATIRPMTASSGRMAQSVDNLKQFTAVQQNQHQQQFSAQNSRPSTAGPLRNGTRPPLSFGMDTRESPTEHTSAMSKVNSSQAFTPLFVEKDKQVCRFYGHFFQARTWEREGPLGDPVIETNQCRRLTIYFYLVDETIEISEPKAPNTGNLLFYIIFTNTYL